MDPRGWQNGWYTPHNPHVYLPPNYYGHNVYHQGPQHTGWRPFGGHARTGKYPNLHPALASDLTLVRYDIRKPTNEGILSNTYSDVYHAPALIKPSSAFRIISKAFPWTIDIKTPANSIVTCGMVWDAIYSALQEPIADSEWGLAIVEKSRKEAIEKAAKLREEKDKDKRMKRIDWLGDTTLFKGLEKDEEFQKMRLLPGTKACPETWIVRFGKP
ncbi:hypothetical protein SERLA73DRAFT_180675 [Serpula lacrymans var. lacrymans S7.3]|uniref:DUF6699 domain-containing protein n=2 Tax=Serpula lacrymans var. lacrymans TaxID=341189 RepID=F8PVS8_SERL3|nr:uncharacterized protein SERLADRAFT_466371 [Serpula lacrymans var. lacrymans S7.9]EGO00212.1 hypothetical protein SERLA73DRAFT_180675 [Serpula lacrymans var. lacrymans S7.3]EGO25766.1 hypothetical protein SERLADRAFT_466371 [Serpula lacrymans var. lacrymans S7.9]